MSSRLSLWVARLLRLQGVRYLLVAGTTALYYLGLVAIGLALEWHYLLAIIAAQAVTIATAFPFYRTFVFESQGKVLPDFARFLSVWMGGMIAGLVVTPLLVEILAWPPFWSQVIAVGAVSLASFAGHRYFSFRNHAARPPASRASSPESEAS
jgi:putative flippase GtrA